MALAYHQTQLLPLYFLAVAICAYLPGRGPFTLALSPAPFLSIKKYRFKMALTYHQTQPLPLYFLAVAICAYLPGRGPFTLAL